MSNLKMCALAYGFALLMGSITALTGDVTPAIWGLCSAIVGAALLDNHFDDVQGISR